jgi:transcriptional regulator with XRE-family HTH domain
MATPPTAALTSTLTDKALLKQLGERLAQLRLSQNLTQAALAEQAGLGLRTVQRLELGEAATQLSGFVRVCRALGIVDRLDALLPGLPLSPIAQLAQQKQLKRLGYARKRASGRRLTAREPVAKKWTWGESS